MSHHPPRNHCYPLKLKDFSACLARVWSQPLDLRVVFAQSNSQKGEAGLYRICELMRKETDEDGVIEISCPPLPIGLTASGCLDHGHLHDAIAAGLQRLSSKGLLAGSWQLELDLRLHDRVLDARTKRWSRARLQAETHIDSHAVPLRD